VKYVTTGAVQTLAAAADGLLLQLNTALTGETIELKTATGGTFALISGPAPAGTQFRYNGLRGLGAVTIEPNATVNITVSFLNREI
jgi:hypothetical protein